MEEIQPAKKKKYYQNIGIMYGAIVSFILTILLKDPQHQLFFDLNPNGNFSYLLFLGPILFGLLAGDILDRLQVKSQQKGQVV